MNEFHRTCTQERGAGLAGADVRGLVAKLLSGILVTTLASSDAVCDPASVCEGKYQVPLFVEDAVVTPTSDDYACGALVHTVGGVTGDTYVKTPYGFVSYKERIPADSMLKFQNFIAAFIHKATGQNLGEFTAADPVVTKIPGSEAYHFIQKFRQVYNNHTYAGAYEIITRVQGDVTNSYFIGYTDYAGRPDFYERFRDWALK